MNKGPDLAGMGRYMALGIQMVMVTAAFAAIGWWLDQKTGKPPVWLAVFFFIGALGGIAVVWRALNSGENQPK